MSQGEEKSGKGKGCVWRDQRQEMHNLEQILEKLEHTSCRRQFKERNYEIDKESLGQQNPESHSFQNLVWDRLSSKRSPARWVVQSELAICREITAWFEQHWKAESWRVSGYSCPWNGTCLRSWPLIPKLGEVSVCCWHAADWQKWGGMHKPKRVIYLQTSHWDSLPWRSPIIQPCSLLGALHHPLLTQHLFLSIASHAARKAHFGSIPLPPPPHSLAVQAQHRARTSQTSCPSLPSICSPGFAGFPVVDEKAMWGGGAAYASEPGCLLLAAQYPRYTPRNCLDKGAPVCDPQGQVHHAIRYLTPTWKPVHPWGDWL